MAEQILINSTLQLVFNAGVDPETGDAVKKYKSFSNVKSNATADQLYAIARAFEGLQELTLYNILRKDTSDIAGD